MRTGAQREVEQCPGGRRPRGAGGPPHAGRGEGAAGPRGDRPPQHCRRRDPGWSRRPTSRPPPPSSAPPRRPARPPSTRRRPEGGRGAAHPGLSRGRAHLWPRRSKAESLRPPATRPGAQDRGQSRPSSSGSPDVATPSPPSSRSCATSSPASVPTRRRGRRRGKSPPEGHRNAGVRTGRDPERRRRGRGGHARTVSGGAAEAAADAAEQPLLHRLRRRLRCAARRARAGSPPNTLASIGVDAWSFAWIVALLRVGRRAQPVGRVPPAARAAPPRGPCST